MRTSIQEDLDKLTALRQEVIYMIQEDITRVCKVISAKLTWSQ